MITAFINNKIANTYVPESEEYTKARMLYKMLSVGILSSVIFSVIYFSINLKIAFFGAIATGFLFILAYFFPFKKKIVDNLSTIFIGGCFFSISLICIDTGGINSVAIPIYVVIPILAFYYKNSRIGYLYSLLTFLVISFFILLNIGGINLENNLMNKYRLTHTIAFNSFSFLFILVLIYIHNLELNKYVDKLNKLNKKFIISQAKSKEMAEQAVSFSTYLAEAEINLKELLKSEQKSKIELQESQTKLVESEKMASLGQLTAGIAHEINNPVNFILTGIEGLKENIQDFKEFEKIREHNCNQIQEAVVSNKINDDHHIIQNSLLRIANAKKEIFYDDIMDELDELVLSIKNGAVRTSEIVTGLRTFSRHDEDSWKLVNIHENIDSTLILLKNIYKDRVEIVKNYGTIPEVDCKPGKLNQVFMNLLVNAIQSIQGEGKVIISTSLLETGEKVRISISDTGTGIPEEIQNKIFDPFFTTKDVGEGTGLGLAITKGILEDHSAELTFITKYGKGTTFNIDIPIKQLNK